MSKAIHRILSAQIHHLTALWMLTETSRRHQWHNPKSHPKLVSTDWSLALGGRLNVCCCALKTISSKFSSLNLFNLPAIRFSNFDLLRWTQVLKSVKQSCSLPVWRTKLRGAMSLNASCGISYDAMKISDVMAMNKPNALGSFLLL